MLWDSPGKEKNKKVKKKQTQLDSTIEVTV